MSVRSITGKPIKFMGIGEKTDGLEPFYPDRLASRILGMGDVLSLIEEAERKVDKDKEKELDKKDPFRKVREEIEGKKHGGEMEYAKGGVIHTPVKAEPKDVLRTKPNSKIILETHLMLLLAIEHRKRVRKG